MRKALVALAGACAMWAGSAQAAYIVTITGTFNEVVLAGVATEDFTPVPLTFEASFTFDKYKIDAPELDMLASSFDLKINDAFATKSSGAQGWYRITDDTQTGTDRDLNWVGFNSGSTYPHWFFAFGFLADERALPLADFTLDPSQFVFVHLSNELGAGKSASYRNPSAFKISIEGEAEGVVPEPATWAMMLAGFGFVGGSIRRQARRGLLPAS
ncbi:PEP-CTERM protein-sorting domain-containing protein [Sphingomonas laterariae]|uniref:PEP-CTERM protein-sorting domain-containing protein n=1 Tax=Edaphosphingomonas laterariae TaxID=861865 RepID=A0A239IIG8_9SPHN|nr:PEPxxWA-CTERM sorting domain-containing protein [Sphingomonas laterariae]SNS93450.1 PEP-CTERM protein-sorting domain-containing protein [Sphingomonas laterariae]